VSVTYPVPASSSSVVGSIWNASSSSEDSEQPPFPARGRKGGGRHCGPALPLCKQPPGCLYEGARVLFPTSLGPSPAGLPEAWSKQCQTRRRPPSHPSEIQWEGWSGNGAITFGMDRDKGLSERVRLWMPGHKPQSSCLGSVCSLHHPMPPPIPQTAADMPLPKRGLCCHSCYWAT
jgi:hypothetical protein